MSDTTKIKPTLDWDVYTKNRARWGVEELRPYAGQWVAWSFEGTRIVASDEEPEQLYLKLEAMGIGSEEVLLECMPLAEHFETQL